jgi:hypothetical protein
LIQVTMKLTFPVNMAKGRVLADAGLIPLHRCRKGQDARERPATPYVNGCPK